MVDLTPIVNAQRLDLAYTAAAKLCYIAEPLQALTAESGDADVETAHQLAIRMAELVSVILSTLSDDQADLGDCMRMLHGPEVARRLSQEAANG